MIEYYYHLDLMLANLLYHYGGDFIDLSNEKNEYLVSRVSLLKAKFDRPEYRKGTVIALINAANELVSKSKKPEDYAYFTEWYNGHFLTRKWLEVAVKNGPEINLVLKLIDLAHQKNHTGIAGALNLLLQLQPPYHGVIGNYAIAVIQNLIREGYQPWAVNLSKPKPIVIPQTEAKPQAKAKPQKAKKAS